MDAVAKRLDIFFLITCNTEALLKTKPEIFGIFYYNHLCLKVCLLGEKFLGRL